KKSRYVEIFGKVNQEGVRQLPKPQHCLALPIAIPYFYGMKNSDALSAFHPVVRSWFAKTFGEPSTPQRLGWPSIAAGKNTLIVAPTGSGKTLSAFLWCINHLVEENISSASKEQTDNSDFNNGV